MIYPKTLEILIEYFKKLPGIGEKSAERLAIAMLDFSKEETELFADTIIKAKKSLQQCEICANLTEEKICHICSNKFRNSQTICVVEDYKSIFVFEKMGKYNGVYHVLNGLISPIEGINPDDINLDGLIKRLDSSKETELIIALKPSIEGETTTAYINKILQKKNVKISRLSYGLPMGAELDYLDAMTLERAFEDRKNIS